MFDILDVKSCSNADCGSDHTPVIAKISLRLKVIHETCTVLTAVLIGICVPMKSKQTLEKSSWKR